MILSDEQKGLLRFLRTRQLPDRPAYFLPQGIAELEAAAAEGRDLPAISIRAALEEAGIPLSAWQGLPIDNPA